MATPQQILDAFKANKLTVETFKTQLCNTQGVIQVINAFMTNDPLSQQVVSQFFPTFGFPLEQAFEMKAENLLTIPGISVDAIQRILAVLSHTKVVLEQVLVLQNQPPPQPSSQFTFVFAAPAPASAPSPAPAALPPTFSALSLGQQTISPGYPPSPHQQPFQPTFVPQGTNSGYPPSPQQPLGYPPQAFPQDPQSQTQSQVPYLTPVAPQPTFSPSSLGQQTISPGYPPSPHQQPFPFDQSSSSSAHDAFRNSNSSSPHAAQRPVSPAPFVTQYTKEMLFDLGKFQPTTHFRLFVVGIDSAEHQQIVQLLQVFPQPKKSNFNEKIKKAIFYFASNDQANQALSAVKIYLPSKNSSVKKPQQNLPLTRNASQLLNADSGSLKSLNDVLRGHGVRIVFKNDSKPKGPRGAKGQKPQGQAKGKYHYEVPEGVNAKSLFDTVVDVIVAFANSRPSVAPVSSSSAVPSSVPGSPFGPAPVHPVAQPLERRVPVSNPGLHSIMEKLLTSPKIVGRLSKSVTATWDAATKQVILKGVDPHSVESWENEIRSWKSASKVIPVEQSQIQSIVKQVLPKARDFCVHAAESKKKSGSSETGIFIKGLESKLPLIERFIQKKLSSVSVSNSISLEIPIFNFIQKIFVSEIAAITAATKIVFEFERPLPSSSSASSSSPSSSSAPPPSPSKAGRKPLKKPGTSWFNEGAPGENRTITFSGPSARVASARSQLQELIDSIVIEEYPPSSSKSSISVAQRATYFQAIEIFKGTKNGIHFLGDIKSASIKMVGRKNDLKGILKRINSIASSITTSQIDLSSNELKAWQDLIDADLEKLKGVCKKINSKCAATINFREGMTSIEIAGTPDNVDLAKQVINNMIGNNTASDPISIPIFPEDSFLISRFFKDQLSSCLKSIPRSTVLLLPQKNRIEFTCPLPEKDRAESLVRAFITSCRSQFRRDELSLDPKYHKIILSKDQKILRTTSEKTGTFIQLKQFSRLMNHADLQADPSKRIELRAGDVLLDTNEVIIIPNDDKLTCSSILGQAIQEKTGPTFVSDSQAALRSGQVIRNGQCFEVQTLHSSSFGFVINLILNDKDSKDPNPKATLQRFIQEALQFADQQGHQSVALPPIGPSQGYSVDESLSALVDACSAVLTSLRNLKTIKIFDVNETALIKINQKVLSLPASQWKIATANIVQVSSFLAQQKQQMISDRLNSLNATKSSLQIWNQWYWREDSHKITPADKANTIMEGGQYFIPYDYDQNLQIEQASQNGLSEVLVVGDKKGLKNGFSYMVNLQRKVQINSTTGFQRQLIVKLLDRPLQPPEVELVSEVSVVSLDQSEDDDVDDSSSTSLEPVEIRIIGMDSASINAAKQMIQQKVQASISERTVNAPSPITPDQKAKIEKMLGNAISFSIASQTVTIKASKNEVDRLCSLILEFIISKQIRKAYPPNWSSVHDPSNSFKATLVQVPAGSPEFNEVQAVFAQTLSSTPIVKIERVENRWLWDQYSHKAEAMKLKNPHIANNELRLFHGTSGADPSSIYNGQHGFDSNFCSQGMWGLGTYFAVNASYSKDYAFNSAQGKQMFLCRVLVGDHTTIPSDRTLRMPPVKAAGLARFMNERYDSVSGTTGGSLVFILYHDHHAYPEYLITFA